VDPRRRERASARAVAARRARLPDAVDDPGTCYELLLGRVQAAQAVNYGLDRVRFVAPVLAGKRVRNRVKVLSSRTAAWAGTCSPPRTPSRSRARRSRVVAVALAMLM